ncbi:hypothetical protein [Chitiniphilus eburneus]|uniref:Uncharacterized protein n=1 Tax=Chitiniphilus eburneus TaxID=2571148 RepID=A0A4U0PZS7_9NEIS|nr:hypothetical protein [Chitiniphilus eburneus]TJZ73192.1 hypothetical protein FAZ21_11280 [Chitiniphilus eburneus]
MVHYFSYDMPGAPVLNGQPGSLIALLNACLVEGWGATAIDSLTVAGEVASVVCGGGHPLQQYMVAGISGAAHAGLNGQFKVTMASGSTLQFAAPGVPDGTYTGTAQVRVAPVGWGRPYTGSNVAVYRAPLGNRFCLRVDDTLWHSAQVRGYEEMSTVDDGAYPCPPNAVATFLYWAKSDGNNTTRRRWMLFADGRTLLLSVAYRSGDDYYGVRYETYTWGEFTSFRPADAFNSLINGINTRYETNANTGGLSFSIGRVYGSAGLLRGMRSYTGAPGATFGQTAASVHVQSGSTSTSDHYTGPNPVDGRIYASPIQLREGNLSPDLDRLPHRGLLRGVYAIPMNLPEPIYPVGTILPNPAGTPGAALLMRSYAGALLMDITGPWSA